MEDDGDYMRLTENYVSSQNYGVGSERNCKRLNQMRRKKITLTSSQDFEKNLNEEEEFNSKLSAYGNRTSFITPVKNFEEGDVFPIGDNEDDGNKENSINEAILDSHPDDENIEVIVSDLDCEIGEDDTQDKEKQNPYATLFQLTKAARSQNSFIKMNNKLKNSLELESDKKTPSYLLALGEEKIEDSKQNYDVDSVIEEEDDVEFEHEKRKEKNRYVFGHSINFPQYPQKLLKPTHKSSKSELIDIKNSIESIKKKIELQSEARMEKKKNFKQNLLDNFTNGKYNYDYYTLTSKNKENSFDGCDDSLTEDFISGSNNHSKTGSNINSTTTKFRALSYEISSPIAISILTKGSFNLNSGHFNHLSSNLSSNVKRKSFKFSNCSSSNLPKTVSKPSSLIHEIRKKILLTKGKAQSLYLKKTTITEENPLYFPTKNSNTKSKKIKNMLVFSNTPTNERANVTACLSSNLDSFSDAKGNKTAIIEGIKMLRFPFSSLDHQRFTLEKVKKSKSTVFYIMISQKKVGYSYEFKGLYESNKKNILNKTYAINTNLPDVIDFKDIKIWFKFENKQFININTEMPNKSCLAFAFMNDDPYSFIGKKSK